MNLEKETTTQKKKLELDLELEKNMKISFKQLYRTYKELYRNQEREIKRLKKQIEKINIESAMNSCKDVPETNSFTTLATNLINNQYIKKQKRDIWGDSKWKNISELENDDVGGVGEEIINTICQEAKVNSAIDGTKTKQVGGGIGDGTIKGKSCEIKTARLGSSGNSFQHELGEVPWKADFMVFLDIAPQKMYITIFKNFTEEFYKKSGLDSSIKCDPYFPTKSITWRKQKGAFKLDTSININEKNNYTFIIDSETTDYSRFKSFVDEIIQ